MDALRFFAAFAVICFHMSMWLRFPETNITGFIRQIFSFNMQGGLEAVNFFFTLSGFLITYLMLSEYNLTSSFNIRLFYFRRIFRIWPVYFCSLITGFIIYPLLLKIIFLKGHYESSGWLMYVFFLVNFFHINKGVPVNGILGVQWSIAVEEQFYLVWPLIFYFVKKEYFPFLLVLLIFFSNAFVCLNIHNGLILQYHSLCALNNLSMGGLLAYFAFYKREMIRDFLLKLNKITVILVYISGFFLIFFKSQLISTVPVYKYTDRFICSLFFLFIISEQCLSVKPVFKSGSLSAFTKLGKISYGLYLYHMIAVYIVLHLDRLYNLNIMLQIVLTVFLSVSVSYLSYTYFEKKFLDLKRKFSVILTS